MNRAASKLLATSAVYFSLGDSAAREGATLDRKAGAAKTQPQSTPPDETKAKRLEPGRSLACYRKAVLKFQASGKSANWR